MALRSLAAALLGGGLVVGAWLAAGPALSLAPADRAASPSLDQLCTGELKIIDLGYVLNASAAYWPGPQYEPFRLKTIATLERDGVLSKAFSSPEHLGTHLDAPNHFERGQPAVDQIPARELFCAGVVIDASGAAQADPDYRLSVADLQAWEQVHGPIPTESVVLLSTGWARFWSQPARYYNRDVGNRLHFLGYSAEAAEWLVGQRRVRGIGIDTLSVDHGISRDFAVHHVINRHGRYGLENLTQLDRLPPRGFYVVVAPMKIETGSGGPARVFAILPHN
jgi:kynurenine formamidase